jgi:protein-disulfide isomerase
MASKKDTVKKTKTAVSQAEKPVVKARVEKTNSNPLETVQAANKDMIMPLLIGAIIVASFGVGFLYGKVTVYEKLGVSGGASQGQPTAQVEAGQAPPAKVVSIDQVKALAADKNNIVLGNPKSKLVFAEFSDPSCPYCHIASGKNGELNQQAGERFTLEADGGTYIAPVPEMKILVDQGKAAYVWMYSPGAGGGELAAQAFYCGHEQGKFWQVHDLIMSAQGYELIKSATGDDAAKIDQMVDLLKGAANAQSLKSCLESGKYAGRIQSDEAVSRELGVSGTPSFFVNETNFGGAYSFADMQAMTDAALK